ncbi:hypothetical protein Tco_0775851 [Tanacetum coccineum]
MMNSIGNNGPSCPPGNPSLKSLKTDNLQDRQEQQVKKKLRLDENIPVKHFCKPIMQTYDGKVIDYIEESIGNPNKDPWERSFDDISGLFDLEIEQLADE